MAAPGPGWCAGGPGKPAPRHPHHQQVPHSNILRVKGAGQHLCAGFEECLFSAHRTEPGVTREDIFSDLLCGIYCNIFCMHSLNAMQCCNEVVVLVLIKYLCEDRLHAHIPHYFFVVFRSGQALYSLKPYQRLRDGGLSGRAKDKDSSCVK